MFQSNLLIALGADDGTSRLMLPREIPLRALLFNGSILCSTGRYCLALLHCSVASAAALTEHGEGLSPAARDDRH